MTNVRGKRIGPNRRRFLHASLTTAAGIATTRIARAEAGPLIETLNPRNRVPLSFIIDDSTCLVNMGHFCMPQFAEAWPTREIYKQPWKEWPREIPDDFVREFGEWCATNGVKGKYSVVPYPACVGWLDRSLPGWSRRELNDSLNLVRELMLPNWDIHPEMITHTRAIDLKTGRPMAEANAGTMENSYPGGDVSIDYLASYLAYALRILKNCGLPCEGITTPGGFGNRVKEKLPFAVHQAVRDVFGAELPHYFKYVSTGAESTLPKLEYVSKVDPSVENLTVNVPAGTGDWFGGWEGTRKSEGHRYCNRDATSGRMVELIERGQPAVMLCHWPGMFCNGTKLGFIDFKNVVTSLAQRFSTRTMWMKVSEIGRYYSAKQLTQLTWKSESELSIEAPLACSDFTFAFPSTTKSQVDLVHGGERKRLTPVGGVELLKPNSIAYEDGRVVVCVELAKGQSHLEF